MEISTDPEHKFELAVALKKFETAFDIACEHDGSSEHKWRHLSEIALAEWKVNIAVVVYWEHTLS